MRLEVTPEEPGRREQTLDAGAETVVALYRLARVAQMHDPSNQAYQRQIEQTEQAVVDYCGRAGRFFSVLFTPSATFVGGELLRGPRGTEDFAAELGTLLEARGISEIIITREVTPEDIFELSRLLAPGAQAGAFQNARIRVRSVEDTARARGLVVEHLPIDHHIARTYGEAIVAVRRLFDELLAGRYVLPPRIKRIAQSLVDLAVGQNPFFVGVSETPHPTSDEALRAVHAAILSAAMAREIGADRAKSVDIVMAALLHDVAVPRIRARAVEQTGRTGEAPEADAELPAGTAATMAGFSGLFESMSARCHGLRSPVEPLHRSARPLLITRARPPTLQARIVAIAHEWSRLRLSPLRGATISPVRLGRGAHRGSSRSERSRRRAPPLQHAPLLPGRHRRRARHPRDRRGGVVGRGRSRDAGRPHHARRGGRPRSRRRARSISPTRPRRRGAAWSGFAAWAGDSSSAPRRPPSPRRGRPLPRRPAARFPRFRRASWTPGTTPAGAADPGSDFVQISHRAERTALRGLPRGVDAEHRRGRGRRGLAASGHLSPDSVAALSSSSRVRACRSPRPRDARHGAPLVHVLIVLDRPRSPDPSRSSPR
ncbi:MAG: hypothetical protein U0235_27500 [Polyangiaceae bacterium]